MRGLLSVSRKEGVADFARGLDGLGWELFSTGGTERALREAGVAVRSVAEMTGFPEILGGRVKTLHPQVHGAILADREDPVHRREMEEHGIGALELVAVNLYPFREAVATPSVSLEDALEQIDIGGPTLLRAAAKSFPHVLVLVDPLDYGPVLEMLRQGSVPWPERRRLAQKAFQHVALYDTVIAHYLGGEGSTADGTPELPAEMTVALEKVQDLRYGENPHQGGALYREVRPGQASSGVLAAEQLGGRELSFNNILDADAAWAVAADFSEPTVAVIKHTNPCGLASHESLAEAYRRALAGDPVSAYGGIVAANRPIDEETAQAIADVFYEIVIAPAFSPKGLAILKRKRNLRLLAVGEARGSPLGPDFRRVGGGFLVQTPDSAVEGQWRAVTRRQPTAEEMADLRFAWQAVRFVKSNAIVLARDRTLLGMGAGQPNRVTSVALALEKAGESGRGAVLASDAFFPFADNVDLAAQGGVTAVVQPGGSVRDEECIRAADAAGMAMVFTGVRHFRH